MSMHKIPLTEFEEAGLRLHHLPVGEPSQLSDCFRIGIKYGQLTLADELEGTRSVIIQHAIQMLNQIGLSGAEADEIVKRGV